MERISNRLRRINGTLYPEKIFMPPKWLVLGVNNTCNLHCKMCDVGVSYTQSNFYENLMGSKPVHMPIELFKIIADQTAAYFPSAKLGFAFTEPLIYSHLEEALAYAKEKQLTTTLTTNGLGLKKWAAVLSTNNLLELNLSLDGPPDLHNFIRGNSHSFAKAKEGIEAMVALKSKTKINVYCVITEWNVGRLFEFVKLMSHYPLAKVGLMHSNFTPQQVADHHNHLFGEFYPATATNVTGTNLSSINKGLLWKEIEEIKNSRWNFPVEFSPEILSKQELERYYFKPEVFIGTRCQDIFSNIMIKSNGDVIPAHGRCYNLTIGNLYNQDLREIWNSAVISKFRRTVTAHGGLLPACSRCCSAFIR